MIKSMTGFGRCEKITKEYKGLKQLKDHSDEILQMSW